MSGCAVFWLGSLSTNYAPKERQRRGVQLVAGKDGGKVQEEEARTAQDQDLVRFTAYHEGSRCVQDEMKLKSNERHGTGDSTLIWKHSSSITGAQSSLPVSAYNKP